MTASAARFWLVVDRADAPLEPAVSLARQRGAPLTVLLLRDTGWAYLTAYPPVRFSDRESVAELRVNLAAAERAVLQRLRARLTALAGDALRWSLQPVASWREAAPADLGPEDVLVLASPHLLRVVANVTSCVHIAGPGQGAMAPIVAVCETAESSSLRVAEMIASASGRRVAVVELGDRSNSSRSFDDMRPLWTQRWREMPSDLTSWLRAVGAAGAVLPPTAPRSLLSGFAYHRQR